MLCEAYFHACFGTAPKPFFPILPLLSLIINSLPPPPPTKTIPLKFTRISARAILWAWVSARAVCLHFMTVCCVCKRARSKSCDDACRLLNGWNERFNHVSTCRISARKTLVCACPPSACFWVFARIENAVCLLLF